MNGILLVDKPKDFTSFDVIAKLRGILKERKIGHGGTLDPMATGVLPILLGQATKTADLMPHDSKVYEGTLRLGITTDTEDITGNVLKETEVNVSESDVHRVMESFIGEYDQIPPMYSAKKVEGKKLYELARKGIEIERKPVHCQIFSLEILTCSLPDVKFRAKVSKGTYIRSLCRDIGERLQTGGVMTSLRRTAHGVFEISDCRTLDEIQRMADEGLIEKEIRPIDTLFPEYSRLTVREESLRFLQNGNKLEEKDFAVKFDFPDREKILVYDYLNNFKAIYVFQKEENLLAPFKMF